MSSKSNPSSASEAPAALPAEALYSRCDPEALPFATTAELDDLDGAVGQSRALEALELGVRMDKHGYNLYVLGRAGSHRHRIVEEFLEAEAERAEPPCDWCYLNNFAEDRKPIAVRLAAGCGVELRRDMESLVEELRGAIPAAFESEHYQNSVAEINQEFEERHRGAMEQLQQEARQHGVSVVQTPHGFGIAPVREGELLKDEDFERLPEDDKKRTAEAVQEMSGRLRQHIESLPRLQKEHRDRIKRLNREVTELAAGEPVEQLKSRYRDYPRIVEHLDAVREDVLQNAHDFFPPEAKAARIPVPPQKTGLSRYGVNVVVDQSTDRKAPIVHENNPNVQNLLGRIEYSAEFGALVTDFTMIRPGALHRANGGYLILDIDRVLLEPHAWSALKRALSGGEIRIESLGQLLGLVSTASLEPEPIPLDLKVVLIGERMIYYLLSEHDSDFRELFKVAADFEDRLDRSPQNTPLYARLVGTLARRNRLLPLSAGAVARVIEHAARLLGDAEKLTTRLQDIGDLLNEASYRANTESAAVVEPRHVQHAIESRIRRLDRVRSETQEEIRRNSVLIDTDGARVGQVNGLAVAQLGAFAFGKPVRITASIRMGDGKIVDIERETELGGAIHSKGVLILSSYLTSKYAPDMPLSMAASLVFEQSYGGVEGDSASVAETCALLSAISDLPANQSLAATGSLNQHGEVQVISGVNEKIEGFFDICEARELTGSQGVLIPKDNVKHLMLRDDVVEAVREGCFHVYPVAHVDEAIALFTGVAAGARDADGEFPPGSVNRCVEHRLKELASARLELERARRERTLHPGSDGPDRRHGRRSE